MKKLFIMTNGSNKLSISSVKASLNVATHIATMQALISCP